ncbi:MAG: multicopper oxidase domain-containing protein [Acidobacteriia bacterium]|nr:multicopper oxidase domain-containing protein [Terriglobia bacterium]
MKTTRRNFLTASAVGGAGLLAGWRFGIESAAAAQTPLAGSAIPQFVDPLPILSVAGGPIETIIAGANEILLTMREFQANMMPSTFVPASGPYSGTWVWGFRADIEPTNPAGTYIGPVIVATRGTPTQIRFVNDLTADNIAWRDWTDQTLHWADPLNGEANACAEASGSPATGDCLLHYSGPTLAVPHLHGGEIPPVLDGGPDAWFSSDGTYHGHAYYTKAGAASNEAIYRYPNTQEAAPIWFHDHVLGATRLNVYAGIAGAYPLIDPNLQLPTGLHPVGLQQGSDANTVEYLIPLVLQDRMFDTNGQLFFPNVGINPEHPYWVPEFVGDTIVVNGKVWPFLNVAPKRYRFLFINGSNARTYELFLVNPVTKAMGPPIWQIATDGGYLDAPAKIDPNVKPLDKLLIMPGERAGVIIDFAGLAGQTLILRNTGRTPYPKGGPPSGSTLGQIIQFRVNQPFTGPDASYNPASGTPLRPPMIRLVNPTSGVLAAGVTANKTRQLTLNEIIGAGGPLEILVNNTKWDGKRGDGSTRSDFTPVTTGGITEYFSELPNEGDTEVWEIVNLTADAHPIHTHLTQFQLLNRQNFNTNKYGAAYAAAFPGGAFIPAYGPPLNYTTGNSRALGGNPDITPFLQGPVGPPDANEAGWKDTVRVLPGQVTRFAVRYAPTDKAIADPNLNYPFDPNAGGHGYVWHCHIIDHEDNEMMRPYKVNAKNVTRTYVQGTDY